MIDVLGNILEPHKDLLGKFAGGTSSIQFLSLLLLLWEIHGKRSSDAYSFDQFRIGVVLGVLTLKMGYLLNDAPMIQSNLLGFAINVFGICVFYFYASNDKKNTIWAQIGKTGLFCAVLLVYSSFLEDKTAEMQLGILITIMIFFLLGLPLLNLPKIMATKSVEGMPLPTIASGTLTIFAWTLYALAIKNSFMVYQNLLFLFMCSIQLSLFAIYPNKPAVKSTKKNK